MSHQTAPLQPLPPLTYTPSQGMDDPLMPSLPMLMGTPSLRMDEYRSTTRSRLTCVKDAVNTALDMIHILNREATEENKIQVKLVLVDTHLEEHTGSISSLKRRR